MFNQCLQLVLFRNAPVMFRRRRANLVLCTEVVSKHRVQAYWTASGMLFHDHESTSRIHAMFRHDQLPVFHARFPDVRDHSSARRRVPRWLEHFSLNHIARSNITRSGEFHSIQNCARIVMVKVDQKEERRRKKEVRLSSKKVNKDQEIHHRMESHFGCADKSTPYVEVLPKHSAYKLQF